MQIPTIRVDRGGPVTINRSDFKPGVDKIWRDPGEAVTLPEEDDRESLLAQLSELGIKPHGRTKTENLRAILAEAKGEG